MKNRYILDFPMKNATGKYMYVKRTAMPFQFDENHNMVTYLHFVHVLGEFDKQPLGPSFLYQGTSREDLKKLLFQKVSDIKGFPYTTAEQGILWHYAYDKVSFAKELAEIKRIKLSTLYTHQRNILSKAKIHLGRDLADIKKVAKLYSKRGQI